MNGQETISVVLPSELVKFLRDAAFREDRTLSGQVRHLVAAAARLAPPPATPDRNG